MASALLGPGGRLATCTLPRPGFGVFIVDTACRDSGGLSHAFSPSTVPQTAFFTATYHAMGKMTMNTTAMGSS